MLASSQERVEQFEQLLQGEAASTVSADEASTVVVSTTLYYSIADPHRAQYPNRCQQPNSRFFKSPPRARRHFQESYLLIHEDDSTLSSAAASSARVGPSVACCRGDRMLRSPRTASLPRPPPPYQHEPSLRKLTRDDAACLFVLVCSCFLVCSCVPVFLFFLCAAVQLRHHAVRHV